MASRLLFKSAFCTGTLLGLQREAHTPMFFTVTKLKGVLHKSQVRQRIKHLCLSILLYPLLLPAVLGYGYHVCYYRQSLYATRKAMEKHWTTAQNWIMGTALSHFEVTLLSFATPSSAHFRHQLLIKAAKRTLLHATICQSEKIPTLQYGFKPSKPKPSEFTIRLSPSSSLPVPKY